MQCDNVIDFTSDTDTAAVQVTPASTNKGTTSQSKLSYTLFDDALDDSLARNDNHKDISSAFTKYEIPLKVSSRTQNYKSVLPNYPTLKLWDVQNKHKFGLIPLGSLKLPDQITPKDINSIQLHNVIATSGKYNFLGDQINVKSQLNPDLWDAYLQDYWDK